MKIDRITGSRTAGTRRSERGAVSQPGQFAKTLEGETPVSSAGGSVRPVGDVGALLAIQEVPDALDERKRGVRRGDDLLDQLEELRHGLLFGNLPVSTVEKLAKMAQAQKDKVSDPRLAEILTEIEIRAEVELAKLGR